MTVDKDQMVKAHEESEKKVELPEETAREYLLEDTDTHQLWHY